MKLFLLSIIAISVACLQGLFQDYNSFLQLKGKPRGSPRGSSPRGSSPRGSSPRRSSPRRSSPRRSSPDKKYGATAFGTDSFEKKKHIDLKAAPRSPSRKRKAAEQKLREEAQEQKKYVGNTAPLTDEELLKYRNIKNYGVKPRLAMILALYGTAKTRKTKIEKSRLLPSFLGTLDFAATSAIFNGFLKNSKRFAKMDEDELIKVVKEDRLFVVITTTARSVHWDMHLREKLVEEFNTEMIDTKDSEEYYCGKTRADNKVLITTEQGVKYVTLLVRMDAIAADAYGLLSRSTKEVWENNDDVPKIMQRLFSTMGTAEFNTVYECVPDGQRKPQSGFQEEMKPLDGGVFVPPGVLSFRSVVSMTPIAMSISEEQLGSDAFYHFVGEAISKKEAIYEGVKYHFPRYITKVGEQVDVNDIEFHQEITTPFTEDELYAFKSHTEEEYWSHVKGIMKGSMGFALSSMNPLVLFILSGAIAINSNLSEEPRWVGTEKRVFMYNRYVYMLIPCKLMPEEFKLPTEFTKDDQCWVTIQGCRGTSASPRVSTTGAVAFVENYVYTPRPKDAPVDGVPLKHDVPSKVDAVDEIIAKWKAKHA